MDWSESVTSPKPGQWLPTEQRPVLDVVISNTSDPDPVVYPGANFKWYAQLPSCVDYAGHRFTVAYPQAGQAGLPIVLCARCGLKR